jgi:purine nucleosidase
LSYVFVDHGGALDDFACLLMLASYEGISIRGTSVTPANCLLESGVSATQKILGLTDEDQVPVAGGTLKGENEFPLAWQLDSLRVNQLPMINAAGLRISPRSGLPAHEFIASELLSSPRPIRVLFTGPLTNLARCLADYPSVEDRIEELIVVGGALEVPGNVSESSSDGSAECNFYWDPKAAKRVFDSDIRITLFPLDATEQVPVTDRFLKGLADQVEFRYSALAGTFWAMSFGTLETTGAPYYCWNSLATSYLNDHRLCSFETVKCDVIVNGPSKGRTLVSEKGRVVKAAMKADMEKFYTHCLEALRRN